MTDAVIVSTARTALAKSWKGAFNMTHGATLGGHALAAAIQRAGIESGEVEDVLIGCATPEGATGSNIARQIAIRGGCPVTTAGMTINRFCSSGLQAIATAAQRVIAGEGDVYAAGGVESISCVQQEANKHMIVETWLKEHKPEIYWPMLQTAENVAKRYNIGRDRQDEYGVRSQQRAFAAMNEGKFNDEIAPMTTIMGVADKASGMLMTREVTISADEGIRGDTTLEGVSKIRTAVPGGTTLVMRMVPPHQGQIGASSRSGNLSPVGLHGAGSTVPRSARHSASFFARWPFASKPMWRMRWKPSGSVCRRKRRMNSRGVSRMSLVAPLWR